MKGETVNRAIFSRYPQLKRVFGDISLVLLGFLLAMGWDMYRSHNELRDRKMSVLSLVQEDLLANESICTQNLARLQVEEPGLKEEPPRYLQAPLATLRTDFWNVFAFSMPRSIQANMKMTKALRELSWEIGRLNELIDSRERFRISTLPHIDDETRCNWLATYNRYICNGTVTSLNIIKRIQAQMNEESE
jgi:hypothetical protein